MHCLTVQLYLIARENTRESPGGSEQFNSTALHMASSCLYGCVSVKYVIYVRTNHMTTSTYICL